MRVRMLVTQYMTESGRERTLDRGQAYDLSSVVAESFIRRGVAVPAEPVEAPAAVTPETREIKPLYPQESNRRRVRA